MSALMKTLEQFDESIKFWEKVVEDYPDGGYGRMLDKMKVERQLLAATIGTRSGVASSTRPRRHP